MGRPFPVLPLAQKAKRKEHWYGGSHIWSTLWRSLKPVKPLEANVSQHRFLLHAKGNQEAEALFLVILRKHVSRTPFEMAQSL